MLTMLTGHLGKINLKGPRIAQSGTHFEALLYTLKIEVLATTSHFQCKCTGKFLNVSLYDQWFPSFLFIFCIWGFVLWNPSHYLMVRGQLLASSVPTTWKAVCLLQLWVQNAYLSFPWNQSFKFVKLIKNINN